MNLKNSKQKQFLVIEGPAFWSGGGFRRFFCGATKRFRSGYSSAIPMAWIRFVEDVDVDVDVDVDERKLTQSSEAGLH